MTPEQPLLSPISRKPTLALTIASTLKDLFLDEFQIEHSRPSLEAVKEFERVNILLLDGETSIVEAARYSLQRSPELMTEPIAVVLSPQDYRLLDSHQLLIAQARILQLTTQLLQESSQQLEAANFKLQRLASLDSLTRIANRRHFDNDLLQMLRQSARSPKVVAIALPSVLEERVLFRIMMIRHQRSFKLPIAPFIMPNKKDAIAVFFSIFNGVMDN